MARKIDINAEVEVTKKNNPTITYKGIITWNISDLFGFEFYLKEMEVFAKCELDSNEWIVKYL